MSGRGLLRRHRVWDAGLFDAVGNHRDEDHGNEQGERHGRGHAEDEVEPAAAVQECAIIDTATPETMKVKK